LTVIFNLFNEELTNFSKIRKWPTYPGRSDSDYYFIYNLNKDQLGKYLNVWFQGQNVDEVKKFNGKSKHVVYDEVITVKKVDSETSNQLYHKKYNPVSINIMNMYGGFCMKAQIHSIDDSSFGIWWNNIPIDELKVIRLKLMDWVNSSTMMRLNALNGEEFLDICVSMGADEESKDYN